jgi:hypothetical protein
MNEAGTQNKSLKNFIHDLRRGLGSAIVELKNNPDRDKYRAIVMRSCLKDIAYDTQVEGTKGFYLYTAVKTFADPEMFLERMAEKYSEKLSWRLFKQLFDTLCCFARDGYQSADEALEKRYIELKNHLPSKSDFRGYGEREQLEDLMIRKLNNGFEAFKQCVNDMGEMITKRGNNDCLWCDSFMGRAEDKFGKEIYSFLKNAENDNAKVFFQMYEKPKSGDGGSNGKLLNIDGFCKDQPVLGEAKEERVTIGQLISRANKPSQDSFRIEVARIRPLALKFARQANKDELKALARITVDESSDFIKTALLRVFSFADFPLDIGPLLPYATSDNEVLQEVVVEALSRIRDERIHALAIRLFDDRQVENAIMLLEANFEIQDETLIRKHLLHSKRVRHDTVTSIANIYEKHKSNTCGDILLHMYKNAECSHCRYTIVETMINSEVMPENILEECQYDSYEDTRIIAREELEKRR